MKKYFADTKIQAIGALLIIGTAILLGLTKWKLPPKNVNLSPRSSVSNQNVNTSNPAFPGRLPDDQILGQQAHVKTSKGKIVFSLDGTQSPIAVSNLITLAKAKYYDDILWHRVEAWVVQAGDPQTKDPGVDSSLWGRGGPGYTIPDEPVAGEYKTGVVAMAKTDAPNSAGSQFFILKADTPLPKTYQILGQVTAGMDVVTALVVADKIESISIEPAS